MNNHSRGLLIAVEGIDRSGKTTQCKLVEAELAKQGVHVELLRYPVRENETGLLIDKYLKGELSLSPKEAHELFARNRREQQHVVQRKLNEGITLIVDRYSYSGIAYSVANGLPWRECITSELGLIAPDLVFYLRLTPQDAASRSDYGAEKFETVSFQTKVYEVYERLNKMNSWVMVDATLDVSQITKLIVTEISSAMKNVPKDCLVLTQQQFNVEEGLC